ncbi:MAG: hypothetical protein WC977_13945 [Anaerovoracaceae bacterium]|jgi:hypothetical protein
MVLMLMSVAVLLVWIVVDRERLDRRKQRACQPFVALGMVEYDGRHFFVCDSVDGPIVKEDK